MKYFFLGLLVSLSSFAFSPPDFQGNVLDQAGVLSESQKSQLHQSIQGARDRAGIWSAVYILPTLNGESIEEVANATFNHWKLGKKNRDNGLLFVVAINDRKMRIEVGYGLEGTLTDFATKSVINKNLKPHFKSGDYAGGIIEGLERLEKIQLKEEVITGKEEGLSDFSRNRALYCVLFNFLLVGIFWAAFFFRKFSGRKYKLHWFGAGLFGGHAAAVGFSLFFSIFWGAGAPLEIVIPFNAIFMLVSGGIALGKAFHVLFSDTAYASWVGPWLTYDAAYEKWKLGFKNAENGGTLTDFIEKNPPPQRPGFFTNLIPFPQGTTTFTTTTWKSTGTSGPSRSSSRSSSSSFSSSSRSSSSGGRSGGGGSSGSW